MTPSRPSVSSPRRVIPIAAAPLPAARRPAVAPPPVPGRLLSALHLRAGFRPVPLRLRGGPALAARFRVAPGAGRLPRQAREFARGGRQPAAAAVRRRCSVSPRWCCGWRGNGGDCSAAGCVRIFPVVEFLNLHCSSARAASPRCGRRRRCRGAGRLESAAIRAGEVELVVPAGADLAFSWAVVLLFPCCRRPRSTATCSRWTSRASRPLPRHHHHGAEPGFPAFIVLPPCVRW